MAENELDSGQNSGTASSPNGAGSAGNGDSGGSFDARKLQDALEALTRKFDEVDSRTKALQGDKDRGVNQTKEEVKELKRKLAEIEKLRKSGLDEDAAVDEFSFREDVRLIKDQLAKLGSASAQPAGNGAGGAVDAAQVIGEFGLDVNDAKVRLELLSKPYKTAEEAEVAAAKFIKAQSKQPTPSDADAGSNPRQPPTSKMTESVAEEKYVELGKLMRNPSQNKSAIEAIKRQLIEGGYPL